MIKKHKCDYCRKQFYWIISLKLHTKILHGRHGVWFYAAQPCMASPPMCGVDGLYTDECVNEATVSMYGDAYSDFEKKYNTNNH